MTTDEITVSIVVHQHPYWQTHGDYELCYVDGQWLYFTESVEGQWGDDWDDAPYEHNAGRPYGMFNSDHRYPDAFAVLATTELEPPSYTMDRYVSVEEVNEGEIPWLALPDFMDETVEIFAGETYREVVSTIEELDGMVYIPREPEK